VKRYGFVFRMKPEMKAEYKKAHDEIWPDMAAAIRQSGIRNYSIFFRKDGTLFGYFECDDAEKAFAYMGRQEVNTRWQKTMDKFFVKSDPTILGPEMEDLEEVFHQD
jgi:L-rhamnose mutarotase